MKDVASLQYNKLKGRVPKSNARQQKVILNY